MEQTKRQLSVFKRVEQKYLVANKTASLLLEALAPVIEADEYGAARIHNLYLDTPQQTLIRASIEKPHFKEKLRLRRYESQGSHPEKRRDEQRDKGRDERQNECRDVRRDEHWEKRRDESIGASLESFEKTLLSLLFETSDQNTFIEIKRKCGSIVCKRRLALPLLAARQFIEERKSPLLLLESRKEESCRKEESGQSHTLDQHVLDVQILRELNWMLDYYEKRYGAFVPSIAIVYERNAFVHTSGLRITVDRNISFKQGSWHGFATGCDTTDAVLLLEPDVCLLEIKTTDAFPLELSALLSELEMFPVSFSKVGRAYEAMQQSARQPARQIAHQPAYQPAYQPAQLVACQPAYQPTWQSTRQPAAYQPAAYQPAAYQPAQPTYQSVSALSSKGA